MAAAKKKAKVKSRKAPARKPAVRKKSKPLKKKAPARKPAARSVSKPRAAPARPAPKPKPAVAAPARPAPLPGEERVGFVTHYYGHLSVAAIRIESGTLRVGDTIRILGHTSDFRQRVESMQIEHQSVTEAGKRQEIGIKVTEHARENDDVYKVTAPQ
jgi:translation elongation factor EF-Tu-like GTPase